MLSLTKKTEYALIAAVHLSRHESDAVISARDIADEHRLRLPLLMNVLKLMHRGGLLQSVRGAKGGYRLAVDPHRVTLRTVVNAIEGPIKLIRCATEGTEPGGASGCCEILGTCPVRNPLLQVHELLLRFLGSVTVGQLAERSAGLPRFTDMDWMSPHVDTRVLTP